MQIKQHIEDYHFHQAMGEQFRLGFISYLWNDLTWGIRMRIGSTICKHKGHKLTDVGSYAGPEGGAEHLECTRCGFSWSNVMY